MGSQRLIWYLNSSLLKRGKNISLYFLARRGRMSSERYCHTPGVIVVVVVVVDNFRLKFLFINLSQVKFLFINLS